MSIENTTFILSDCLQGKTYIIWDYNDNYTDITLHNVGSIPRFINNSNYNDNYANNQDINTTLTVANISYQTKHNATVSRTNLNTFHGDNVNVNNKTHMVKTTISNGTILSVPFNTSTSNKYVLNAEPVSAMTTKIGAYDDNINCNQDFGTNYDAWTNLEKIVAQHAQIIVIILVFLCTLCILQTVVIIWCFQQRKYWKKHPDKSKYHRPRFQRSVTRTDAKIKHHNSKWNEKGELADDDEIENLL